MRFTGFCILISIALTSGLFAQLDLLVIGPKAFKAPLDRLVQHKNQTGISAEYLPLESFMYGEGADEAEKIKLQLHNLYKKLGLKYVFIIGDSSKFPVRYSAQAADAPIGSPVDYAFTASDLYYADLEFHNDPDFGHADGTFSSWNEETGSEFDQLYFAQIHKENEVNYDEIDMVPELAVGRLPAKTVAEVETYVDKVIRYEQVGNNSDRVLLIGNDEDIGSRAYSERLAGIFSSGGLNNFRIYSEAIEQPGDRAQNLANPLVVPFNLALGSLFTSIHAHGRPSGWYFLEDTQVASLTNGPMLPVMFLNSCDTAQFAPKQGSKYMGIDYKSNVGSGAMLHNYRFDTDHSRSLLVHNKQLAEESDQENGDFEEQVQRSYAAGRILLQRATGGYNQQVVTASEFDGTDGKSTRIGVYSLNGNELITEAYGTLAEHDKPLIDTGFFDGRTTHAENIVVASSSDDGNCVLTVHYIEGNVDSDLVRPIYRSTRNTIVGFTPSGLSVADFDGDGPSEVALWGENAYGDGRLYLLEWYGNARYLSIVETVKIDAVEFGGMASGDLNGDVKNELVLTLLDNKGRVACLAYAFGDDRKFHRIHDVRVSDATIESAVAIGNIDGNVGREVLFTCRDSKDQLCLLAYEVTPGVVTMKRLGSIRFPDCEHPKIALGNIDDDFSSEIVFGLQDSVGRGRHLYYNYLDNGNFERITDRWEPGRGIPTGIVCHDSDLDGTDEIAFSYYQINRYPPPPLPIQPEEYDPDSIVENLLCEGEGGAIAIVACVTGAQSWGDDLGAEFFQGWVDGERIVGDMWKQSIIEYFQNHPRGSMQPTDAQRNANERWTVGAEFFQPAKYNLFGDPSLRMPQ